MAIVRVEKTRDYTVLSNAHFREREMSLKAKGLLSLMLSLPDDWDFSIAGLVSLSKDGKESVMNALNELERFGYLRRVKRFDDKKRFAGYDYNVYENPNTENPNTENPNTENPNTENPKQLNTNNSNMKISIPKECIYCPPNGEPRANENGYSFDEKKDEKPKQQRFKKPTIEEIQAYCNERGNGIDAEHFFAYYESRGWLLGKTPMKDWKAAVITWDKKKKNDSNGYHGNNYNDELARRDDPTRWCQPPENQIEYPF